jgi:hypothetical protein
MKKEQKKETVVVSVRVTKEAWKTIRIRSIEEGRQMWDVVGQAIAEYVAKPIRGGVRS